MPAPLPAGSGQTDEIHFTGAVADLIDRNTESVENGELQIRQRRVLLAAQVTAALDCTGAAADDQHRQVVVGVEIAVADPAPVHEREVIEQGAVAVGSRVEL